MTSLPLQSTTNEGATLRSVAHLVEAGLVSSDRAPELEAVAARYPVAITPSLAALIDSADPADPIGRQFIPNQAELHRLPEERADPIGDHAHMPVPGIVHRYPDRVLLKPLHACPVYCRFCFRREMVGPGGEALSADELTAAIQYVAAHNAIFEVIITGGDPFMLAPRRLAEIVHRLSEIPHVAVIRIHTRVPVADPSRVNAALIAALQTEKAMFVSVHANHSRELGEPAAAAIGRLSRAGITLVGQTVLLRGVNNDAATLEALFRRMVALRIKPYYLHHADLAPGTAHFRTTIEEGQELVRQLRGRLSGLCQPTYVLDLPGGHGKVPLGPTDVISQPDKWHATDFRGGVHHYSDP